MSSIGVVGVPSIMSVLLLRLFLSAAERDIRSTGKGKVHGSVFSVIGCERVISVCRIVYVHDV